MRLRFWRKEADKGFPCDKCGHDLFKEHSVVGCMHFDKGDMFACTCDRVMY